MCVQVKSKTNADMTDVAGKLRRRIFRSPWARMSGCARAIMVVSLVWVAVGLVLLVLLLALSHGAVEWSKSMSQVALRL